MIALVGTPGGGIASVSDESVEPRLDRATAALKYDNVPSKISRSLFSLATVLSSCTAQTLMRTHHQHSDGLSFTVTE